MMDSTIQSDGSVIEGSDWPDRSDWSLDACLFGISSIWLAHLSLMFQMYACLSDVLSIWLARSSLTFPNVCMPFRRFIDLACTLISHFPKCMHAFPAFYRFGLHAHLSLSQMHACLSGVLSIWLARSSLTFPNACMPFRRYIDLAGTDHWFPREVLHPQTGNPSYGMHESLVPQGSPASQTRKTGPLLDRIIMLQSFHIISIKQCHSTTSGSVQL